MKIFLCRHGQTTGDIEDRYGGDYEDHLTPLGIRQAQELADKLENKGIQIIFSSPRIRARETADILKMKLDTETVIADDFKERNHYGILTGMTKAEAKAEYPEETVKVKDYRQNAANGEDYALFLTRISRGKDEILNSGFKTAALVTHGGVIRAIFREWLHLGEITLGDCAWAEIDYTNNQFNPVKQDGITLLTNK